MIFCLFISYTNIAVIAATDRELAVFSHQYKLHGNKYWYDLPLYGFEGLILFGTRCVCSRKSVADGIYEEIGIY